MRSTDDRKCTCLIDIGDTMKSTHSVMAVWLMNGTQLTARSELNWHIMGL